MHSLPLTLKRGALLLMIVIIAVAGRAASSAQAAGAGLRVQGVNLVTNDGTRFIVSGVNMEMYRDYDTGCGYVTDDMYTVRSVMADRLKNTGINAVRLNYSYRFLNQAGNLARYLDMAQELAARGIYVMPSDHTYTGKMLTDAPASYPMMKQIVEGMRARGLENYLIMNPFNEPGPNISTDQWVQNQKDVLTYLRNTAGFQGIVVMDGSGWATLLDVTAFKSVMSFDASLRGGTSNVAFSMHLYPNITDLPAQLWNAAKQVPLVVGELGQINPGASDLDPQYVQNVITDELTKGIPNGHNGLFAWIWAWCDSNGMLEEDTNAAVTYNAQSPLTSHGQLWVTNYYSKLAGQSTPIPTVIAQQPTATNTALPPTATRTTLPATATKTTTPRPATATKTTTPRPATATKTSVAPTLTPTSRAATATRTLPPATATKTATPNPAENRTFYRAINFGGNALTLNGNAWEASATAPNLTIRKGSGQGCDPYATLIPTADAVTTQMMQCYVEHWSHNIALNAVPNATYDVYLYTWQDWDDPTPGTTSFSLNNAVMQANYAIPTQAGRWDRLGPWRVTVTAGSLKLTSDGENVKLAGMEVWRVGSSSVVIASTSTVAPLAPTFVPNQAATPMDTITNAASQPLTQVIESDDARLIRTGDWQAQSTDKASGGSYLFTSTGRINFTFTGTQFDVLYVQHPALGTFMVEVDGVAVQFVNSRNDQTQFKAVTSIRGLAAGQHTVAIYPSDGVAAIDAVVLATNATIP